MKGAACILSNLSMWIANVVVVVVVAKQPTNGHYTWGDALQISFLGNQQTRQNIQQVESEGPCENHLCGEKAHCVVVSDTDYICQCLDGYEEEMDPNTGKLIGCQDKNECEDNPCDPHAYCVDHDPPTKYVCTCNDGFEGDGTICVDIDECSGDTECLADVTMCQNTEGGYSCECIDESTMWNGAECVAADNNNDDGEEEATTDDGGGGGGGGSSSSLSCDDLNCDSERSYCVADASSGALYCHCKTGFLSPSGRGGTCIDVNECENGSDDCASDGGICVNRPGGYYCLCETGYTGNGRTCVKQVPTSPPRPQPSLAPTKEPTNKPPPNPTTLPSVSPSSLPTRARGIPEVHLSYACPAGTFYSPGSLILAEFRDCPGLYDGCNSGFYPEPTCDQLFLSMDECLLDCCVVSLEEVQAAVCGDADSICSNDDHCCEGFTCAAPKQGKYLGVMAQFHRCQPISRKQMLRSRKR